MNEKTGDLLLPNPTKLCVGGYPRQCVGYYRLLLADKISQITKRGKGSPIFAASRAPFR